MLVKKYGKRVLSAIIAILITFTSILLNDISAISQVMAAESYLYTQDFAGSDGSQPDSWKKISGNLSIVSNQYTTIEQSIDTYSIYNPTEYPDWKNVRALADIQLNGGNSTSGISIRSNSTGSNYYYARIIVGNPGKLELTKVSNNIATVIKSEEIANLALGAWYTLEFSAYNEKLKAVVTPSNDPTKILGTCNVEDKSFLEGGTVGLKARQGSTAFDNLMVYSMQNPLPNLTLLNTEFTGNDNETPANWSVKTGTAKINSNQYYVDTTADTVSIYSFLPAMKWKNANIAVDVRLTAASTFAGSVFRANAAGSTYYHVRISPGNPGSLQILKIVSGAATVLKTENIPISTNVYYTIDTSIIGDQIIVKLYKSGEPDAIMAVMELQDTAITSAGNVAATVGIKSKNGTAFFDNVKVTEIKNLEGVITYASQSFIGNDNTQPLNWRQLYGNISIRSNEYYAGTTADTVGQYYPPQFPRWSDLAIKADVNLTSDAALSGIAFRMNAAGSDYYFARLSAPTDKLEICKVSGVDTTVLQSVDIKSLKIDQWYTLYVYAVGSRIKAELCERDYAPVVLASAETSDTSILTGGTVGLKAKMGNTAFDNVNVEYLSIFPEEAVLEQGNASDGWSTAISGGSATNMTFISDSDKSVFSGNSMKLHFDDVNPAQSTAPAVIGLAKNIQLPKGSKRIGFYLNTRDASVSSLSVEVKDTTGEIFKYPVYNPSGTPWEFKEVVLEKMWDSTRHSGGNNDGVPDGNLTLTKINLAINPIYTEGGQAPQDIYIDEITAFTYPLENPPKQVNRVKDVDLSVRYQGGFSGFKTHFYQDNTLPYIPLGHILPRENGTFRVSYTIERDDAIVAWDDIEVTNYNPTVDDRRRLYFDLKEEASYFVYVNVKDATGKVIASDMLFSVQVNHGKPPVVATDRTEEYYSQNISLVHLNPDRSNTYESNEPVVATVNLYKPVTGSYTNYSWEYDIVGYADLLSKQTLNEPVDFGSNNVISKTINFTPPEKGAYYITMRLFGDGNLIEQKQKMIGIKPDPYDVNFNTEGVISYEELTTQKQDIYNLAEVRSFGSPHNEYFESMVDKAAQTNTSIDMIIYWNEIEPMKGVYQYEYVQKRLDYAASKGVKVILGIWNHLDHIPLWLWYDDMLDQDYKGRQYSTTYLRNYTRSSERMNQAYKDMIANVVSQFRNNTAIIGWNFSEGVESWYADRSTFGYVTDYSRFTRDEFVSYLQNTKGFTLAEVNTRYESSYNDWDEVELPRPDWDANPDLSKYWVDFQEFKLNKVKTWYNEYMSHLRTYDNVRAIFQYGILGNGPIENFAPVFKNNKAIIAHGGSDHILEQFYEGVIKNEGIFVRAEAAATPPKKSQVSDSIFNMSPYGDYLGINYQMVRNWKTIVENNDEDYYESIQYLSDLKKIITGNDNNIKNSQVRESGLGALFSYDSLIYGTKSLNWLDWGSDIVNKLYFFNDVEHMYPSIISDYTKSPDLAGYNVILDTGSKVLPQQSMDKLKGYVEIGGKLVLFADSGKYNKDTGAQDRYLLTQLGLNAVSWANKGTGLNASVVQGNGVIDEALLPSLSLSSQYYINPVVEGGYTVLATYSNGYPAAIQWNYGSGQVVLILGELNWATPSSNKGLLDSLQGWGGFLRYSDCTNEKVRFVTRQNGQDIFAIAYYRPWKSTTNYSQTDMNSLFEPTSAALQIKQLAEGSYDVYEVTESGNVLLGTYTSAQLETGLDQSFVPGELKFLKITASSPTITEITPVDGSTGVNTDTNIVIQFNQVMDACTLTEENIVLSSEGISVTSSVYYQDNTNTLILSPVSSLLGNTTYNVSVSQAVYGSNNMPLDREYNIRFTTAQENIVSGTSPARDAINVAIASDISLMFEESMNPETINEQNIWLTCNNVSVSASVYYDIGTNTIRISPINGLEYDCKYKVLVGTGVQKLSGKYIANEYSFAFSTVSRPKIVRTVPAAGESGVDVKSRIYITFSEAMDTSTFTQDNITVTGSAVTVAKSIVYDANTNTLAVIPIDTLTGSSTYTVALGSGIKSIQGIDMEGYRYSFTTAQPPDTGNNEPLPNDNEQEEPKPSETPPDNKDQADEEKSEAALPFPINDIRLWAISGQEYFESGLEGKVALAINVADLKDSFDVRKIGVYRWDEQLKNWIYIGGKYDKASGKMIFEVNEAGTYGLFQYDKTFADVPENHWAKTDIEILAAKHIVSGISEDKFDPSAKLTRAQFAIFIAKALGLEKSEYANTFSDVKEGQWYTWAVEAAYRSGILQGKGNGEFEPDEEITREQMAVMIIKAYEYLSGEKAGDEAQEQEFFKDMDIMSLWAVDSVKAAKAMGIISGMPDKTFRPRDNATRAEVAKMLVKLLDLVD